MTTQEVEAGIIDDAADDHCLQEPIGADGSNEYFRHDGLEAHFGQSVLYRQVEGQDGIANNHNSIRQEKSYQILRKLSFRLLYVYKIASYKKKGRHEK